MNGTAIRIFAVQLYSEYAHPKVVLVRGIRSLDVRSAPIRYNRGLAYCVILLPSLIPQ